MQSPSPYKSLGRRLRSIREQAKESAVEVSGAVEIEVDDLGRIERGELRPSEDILLLLITHFGIKDDDAMSLWQLAGYEHSHTAFGSLSDEFSNQSQTVLVVQNDTRIVYTDTVHVMVNNYGVIMNFMQGGGMQSSPQAVARVGMSLEHAKSVLEVLRQTIDQATKPPVYKALPSSRRKNQKHKDKS